MLLAAVLAAARCAPAKPPPQVLQGAVVFLLDTVRADHVSCYGYARPTTPSIDALAARGVRFEQAISSAPWTLPSTVALLSAEYPERVYDGRLRRSVAERLRAAGIATAAVTEGAWVSKSFGLDLGFATWEEEQGAVQLLRSGERMDPDAQGGIDRTFALARDWLGRHRAERFFLLVHTYEPHAPYVHRDFVADRSSPAVGRTFPIELLDRLQSGEVVLSDEDLDYVAALYDGDIRNADRHVGSFLSFLQQIGLDDRTLVVVTSDHGEEMGDHDRSRTGDHGHSLYDSLLHVPLIVSDPVHAYPVRSVAAQVRLLDVLPTVADLLGVRIPEPLDGATLVPLLRGTEEAERPALAAHTRAGPPRVGLRALGYKHVVTVETGEEWPAVRTPPPPRELYDLASDPAERTNLLVTRPEMAGRMAELLEAGRRGLRSKPAPRIPERVDPELVERLRSLGYVR